MAEILGKTRRLLRILLQKMPDIRRKSGILRATAPDVPPNKKIGMQLALCLAEKKTKPLYGEVRQ